MTRYLVNQTLLFSFLIFLCVSVTYSQENKGRIVDIQTGEGIPYASVIFNNNESNISNEEGFFTISEKNSSSNTQLVVTYLGYISQSLSVDDLLQNQYIIKLQPSIFELNEIQLSNKKLSALEIMALVKSNLKSNYSSDKSALNDKIFYRESVTLNPSQFEVEITKSTGFTKDALKKANKEMALFTSKTLKQSSKEYTDILADFYQTIYKKDEKQHYLSKLAVIKATKLRNKNSSSSIEALEEAAKNQLYNHIDTTKYYRVKSGLFGSRDTVPFGNSKKKDKISNIMSTKTKLTSFQFANGILNNKKFDFIKDLDSYEYTYEGANYINNNEFVYIISFKPDRRSAIYSGKLYVSDEDYSVLRVDYSLVEGKKVDGFNMKFLLGVKQAENVSNGTIMYKKNPIGTGYYIQYATEETGQYIYVNRPLKFIEITDKKDEDVVAFDLKIEVNIRTKRDYLTVSRDESATASIEKITEKDFTFEILKAYDPKVWKNYISIEPFEEMKQYRATE